MRFKDFLERNLSPVLVDKENEVKRLATQINGGWEVWLQVETWLLSQDLLYFEREPFYPGTKYRADFKFNPRLAPNITIWVELKTQRQGRFDWAIGEFYDDCNKINGIYLDPGANTLGAVVAIAELAGDAFKEVTGKDKIRYGVYSNKDRTWKWSN